MPDETPNLAGDPAAGQEWNFDRALELATRLTTIKDFPRFRDAIEATAEDLMRWCKGARIGEEYYSPESQAYWLVTEARQRWFEWTSTADLYTLFREKFQPNGAGPSSGAAARTDEDLYHLCAFDCRTCYDTGILNGLNGEFCTCRIGQEARKRNAEPAAPSKPSRPIGRNTPPLQPITQADIDALKRKQEQARQFPAPNQTAPGEAEKNI